MGCAVGLASDLVKVEPGSTVPVGFFVTNRAESVASYEVSVEGLDPEWVALPVATFIVEPGATRSEKFFLRPPRESHCVAGIYPFVLTVRDLDSGESVTVQGSMDMGTFHHFSLDLNPKKASLSPFNKETAFDVSVMNLGNGEETVQMFASDTDNAVAFEFDADQATIGPGQQRQLRLSASSARRNLISSPRLQNFSVSSRSVTNPAIAASSIGQIEQRALVTPGTVALGALLALLAAAWIAFWPKPPVVEGVAIKPEVAMLGGTVEIQWTAEHARSVVVRVGDWSSGKLPPNGTVDFNPESAGTYEAEVIAFNGDLKSAPRRVTFRVEQPPKVPDPLVLRFDAESTRLKPGEPAVISYKFNEAVTSAMLFPMQTSLDISSDRIVVPLGGQGEYKLWIKAKNSSGKEVVSRSLSLSVASVTELSIVKFAARPTEVDPASPLVKLEWTVANAKRIEIVSGAGEPFVSDQSTGSTEVEVTQDTTFKLVAYDSEGKTVESKEISVKIKKPAEGDPASGAPATTGGH